MNIFSSAKAKLAAQKLAEEHLYELAAEEIAANNIRPGLYAKALAETDGNEDAARARYIKLRVETMKAEADLADFVASEAETKSHRNNSSEDSDSENLMVWVFVGFCVVILVVFLLLFAAISQV